jgi:photosystem II stability/assembly factor-like uncharacterized protein
MRFLFGIATIVLLSSAANAQWVRQKVDTTASFRGLAVVNEKIVWASGTDGTVIRTIDSGKTWNVITVPGAEKLDFRDIEAFDANTAYILSIGNGDLSRIYKTADGGKTWKIQFKNDDPKAFYDAIVCPSEKTCFALSDPVNGVFVLIASYDGGDTWNTDYGTNGLPKALAGEAAFAASGTAMVQMKSGTRLIVTGGTHARLLRGTPTLDYGALEWQAVETPIVSGSAGSGIFAIAMLDEKTGVIVGGNYEKPDEHDKNLAFTRDEGATWQLMPGLTGYRSGVTYIDRNTIIAVGTNGSDITCDGGKTWSAVGKENLNAVASKDSRSTWAVGPKGTVVKLKHKAETRA